MFFSFNFYTFILKCISIAFAPVFGMEYFGYRLTTLTWTLKYVTFDVAL